jgi:DNA modification methylase
MGKHRLICGDCTDKATVERLMQGERAQAVVTDPPYGTASGSKVQKRGDRIETFDIEWDKEAPIDWIPIALECLDDGSAILSFWDNKDITRLWDSLKNTGFNPLQTVYWKKTTVPQPRPNFCSSIESAVFARKPGKVLCWNGGGATPNVFDANRAAGNERVAHETQKPLSLFSWLIGLITDANHLVYEPFGGSGTAIIACEQLNRQCRAVEISPAYCAVILQRYKDSTNVEPVLIDTVTKQ